MSDESPFFRKRKSSNWSFTFIIAILLVIAIVIAVIYFFGSNSSSTPTGALKQMINGGSLPTLNAKYVDIDTGHPVSPTAIDRGEFKTVN